MSGTTAQDDRQAGGPWLPPPDAPPVPWTHVERSLRIPQRWARPHLLLDRGPEHRRRAAVAVLLWGDPRGARKLVLVQRGAGAPHHAGELAFPGGMAEPADRDLPATALRELREELDPPGPFWELGCFPDGVAKARTRFTPVFYRWEVPEPSFRPGPEIQDVLVLPLLPLLRAPWRQERLEAGGLALTAPRLELPLAPLWGATALVLVAWLEVLATCLDAAGPGG